MAYLEAGMSREEVFLSFRGPDTRYTFTDFLSNNLLDVGIHVFKDDEELREGDVIGGNLLHAINNSTIYIPIFSPTYASSIWCLRELTHIVDNVSKSNNEKIIRPIFFEVEPDDVKLYTPLYSDTLLELAKEFPTEAEQWRKALRQASKSKGWVVDKHRSQAAIVNSVVEFVLERLRIKEKSVPEHLIGHDDLVEDLMELLDVNRGDVCVIGIYGMGGIGKTTIAKVIFNQLCSDFGKNCSFLEGVRERSTEEGIVELQKKLLCDIAGSRLIGAINESEQGMCQIREILRNKKVLLVLDDVHKKEHIKYLIGNSKFLRGSRIIITTRDKDILQAEGFEDKIYRYEMQTMHDSLALQLFCWHAFHKDYPSGDYREMSKEIVSCMGGLPLAIEVVGSLLEGKDKALWEETLVRLSEVPEQQILEKLRISYDDLDNYQKQIFLDIACFFLNENKTDAIYMWDSCKFHPKRGIEVLIKRCLIKVLDNGKFWMHEQLIALGRQIVRESCLDDLTKQSRLWIAKEALEILRTKKLKAWVQGLEINVSDDSIKITDKEMQMLPNLRLLKLGNGTYDGDFARCFPRLRWFSWHSPPQDFRVDNLSLDCLVVFKLDKNGFTDDSKAWDLIKGARNLKVLSLTECDGITTIPNFSKCLCLERLTLARCDGLNRIERFIGDLPSLIELEIEGCINIADLPEEVGALVKLKRFSLRGCSGLREIPGSLGYLISLIELDLSYTGIVELPNSIQGLVKLESFLLRDTKIRKFPNSIEKLKSLRILRLSINEFSSLKHVWQLPSGISMLENLEELDLSGCAEMKGEIPIDIEELSSLKILNLKYTGICRIPRTIDGLHNLQTLDLRDCHEIQALPRLPTSLTYLFLQSKSLFSVPDLSNLINLVELLLSDDSHNTAKSNLLPRCDFKWIGRLCRLKKLDLNLLNVLASPELASLFHLRELTLRHLDLETLMQLPSSHWSLRSLLTLGFYQCKVEDIPLDRLTQLEKFTIDGCRRLQRLLIPLELRKLRQAWVSHCPELVEIQVVGLSKSLESLRVFGCESLRRICGLSHLKNLEELVIQRCDVLTDVEGLHELESLTSLKSLDVKECISLRSLIDASCTTILGDCLIEKQECGDFIKQGAISLKRYREEILLDTSNKRMKKMKDEARQLAADRETSDTICAIAAVQNVVGIDDRLKQITDLPEVEVNDESKAKMEEEARQRAADMETSDRNYAIAAVQNVVGIDDRVKQITDLLEMEVNDEVRIIGIYGTDGIGKTTLAKAVYNRISSCFDSCSFLAEVEQTTQNPRGIQFLQTKLIRDILQRDREDPSFDERIESFLDIFREMKVLIVVDDVEKQSHLQAIVGDQPHWFGLGSRIIVTSINSEILKDYDLGNARSYMVHQLDNGQAFELFCKHAFGMQSSINDYERLPNCIVNATVKLPLAVEVIGSFLRGKSEEEWKKTEELMKQLMMSSQKTTVGCKEILDICYKALDPKQKHVFLDIACFISGVDARIASYMWSNPHLPSSDCILMPLAKTGENNELQIHRLLRCLGKRILDQEESEDPIPRKFHIHVTVPEAISNDKGMENIEALSFDLDDHDSCVFTARHFESMPGIRFLQLDNARVSGDFARAFPSLRWLCWQRCPLDFGAMNFVLRELVIFDLSWSKVVEDWGGWSEIKMEKLKVLNLTGCSDLLITPDFSDYKDLEILILERCSRLVKLDPSIGHLKRLVSLNLKSCFQLNRLPVELGHATALEELFIDGTSVREIPISVGNLKQLKILSGFKCFQLTQLPSSISYLTALSVLSLDGAKISELPSSLGELLNLRRLSLRDCHYMQVLPDSIGKMGSSLEELDISATSISRLPNSMRNLQNLRVLKMDSSFIRAFPVEIGNLTKLEELHASWCRSLEGAIPRDIKRLHHLRSLTLGHSGISSLPSEISTISSLQTLDLLQCNGIEVLPELPSSLIFLRVSSKRMKAIPPLKNLKELEELCLSDEDPKERQPPSKRLMPESKVKKLSIWFSRLWNLEFLQTPTIEEHSFSISFPKLRKLELSLSRIMKLQYEPPNIPQLKTLTLSGLSLEEVSELPKTLSVLSIRGCASLKRLPIVQCLTNISAFELHHSAIEEIEGLEGLNALKRLDISNCKIRNLNGIGQLTSLRSLILSDCDDLSLPDLSNLKSLKILEIRQCKMIHKIEGLEKLCLEKLNISECPAENSVLVENVMARLMVT